ncbi:MAG: methylenetetrahydrofolate dehydrogenase (NADP+) / methenyltetrahydrofolate cyclohydrolase [Candidatus Tokpelaia sp. JSC085]|nr:MAG: methylenetetrahydrofolate dehydrogenase (NADP+) / methenyltetrahydrofolate cyclohydrolase [Candidatus Tokpelaia sp. JSC085]
MVGKIDGKQLAEEIVNQVQEGTVKLIKSHNIHPGLAVIIVGDDVASQIYVASKNNRAKECGFHSVTHQLDVNTREETLIELIHELNEDPLVHGILVQLPLPEQIRQQAVVQAIAPVKDVDGFHYNNIGKLVACTMLNDSFVPCTPAGIMMMIRRLHGNDLSGLDAVVVGRSNIVGKPVATLLLSINATTTIAHSRTRDLPDVVRSADILVVATGQPEMVKGSWIKPGATVIDVGINRISTHNKSEVVTRIVGDVEYDTASMIAKAITPVPGGVGPMTIAMLMANTLKAACLSIGSTPPSFC